jgi:hypothetical protein
MVFNESDAEKRGLIQQSSPERTGLFAGSSLPWNVPHTNGVLSLELISHRLVQHFNDVQQFLVAEISPPLTLLVSVCQTPKPLALNPNWFTHMNPLSLNTFLV